MVPKVQLVNGAHHTLKLIVIVLQFDRRRAALDSDED